MSHSSDTSGRGDSELWSLVEAHAEGLATPDERHRLEQRLATDEEARRFFVAYMQEQAQIAWLARGGRAPISAPASPVLGFLGSAVKFSSTFLASPKAIALTVAGCLATYFVGLMISIAISRGSWFSNGAAQNSATAASVAARIVAVRDANWEGSEPDRDHSTLLPVGVSRLNSGVVEIEFNRGARVQIEGPAEFTPQSAGRIELTQGRLTAYVPRPARGFTVGTPTAEVVDLGTEFAMTVDADGQTEVHVVRGLVDVKPAASAGVAQPGSTARLSAGSAIRVSKDQGITAIPFDGEHFKVPQLAGISQSRAPELPNGEVRIVNASFETPTIQASPSSVGAHTTDMSDTGWRQTGGAGILSTTLAQPSEGSQAVYVGFTLAPASIYQHACALLPNAEYTLTVDVVPRADDDALAGSIGFIALVNGTDDRGTILAKNTSIVQPTRAAGVQTCSVSFTTDASARGALTIVLGHDASADVTNLQVLYDNVRLVARPVSQPAATAEPASGANSKAEDPQMKPVRQSKVGRSRDRRQFSP